MPKTKRHGGGPTKRIQADIHVDDYKIFEAAAAAERRSMSSFIYHCIDYYLSNTGRPLPTKDRLKKVTPWGGKP